MIRQDTKWPVNASDVWGVVTLAIFIGLIFTLALQTSQSSDRGEGFTISSQNPTAETGPARL